MVRLFRSMAGGGASTAVSGGEGRAWRRGWRESTASRGLRRQEVRSVFVASFGEEDEQGDGEVEEYHFWPFFFASDLPEQIN